MPQRRQQDPRRMGQLAQYHPGGGDVRSQGRSQGPLTGDPSVTAPTERTAPAQQSPLFAGGPGEQPPQLERAAPVDTQMAGEGLMAPGFGGDTDMQARPAPTEGGKPTSAWSDPGLQAPIPPPIPEPIPDRAGPDIRSGPSPEQERPPRPEPPGPALPPPDRAGPDRAPDIRRAPPPPPGPPQHIQFPGYQAGPPPGPPGPGDPGFIMPGPGAPPPPQPSRPSKPDFRAPWDPTQQVYDYMPGDPGYNPDEGRGMFSPWIPGPPNQPQRAGAQEGVDTWQELHEQAIQDRERQWEAQNPWWSPPQPVPTTVPPLEGIGHAGSNPGLQAPRGQQRERDMQRAQRRDARRARPLRA
jgi:hypothetical protein